MGSDGREVWRLVERFPKYIVSNIGRVKRIGRKVLKQTVNSTGYPGVNLYKGTKASGTQVLIPHLVLTAFKGPRPTSLECCHNDGNRLNSHIDNLRWGTHSSNVQDALRHGTHYITIGEKNGRAKLTEEDVKELLVLYWSGSTVKSLSIQFGLHPNYLSSIVVGKRWKHVYKVESQARLLAREALKLVDLKVPFYDATNSMEIPAPD